MHWTGWTPAAAINALKTWRRGDDDARVSGAELRHHLVALAAWQGNDVRFAGTDFDQPTGHADADRARPARGRSDAHLAATSTPTRRRSWSPAARTRPTSCWCRCCSVRFGPPAAGGCWACSCG